MKRALLPLFVVLSACAVHSAPVAVAKPAPTPVVVVPALLPQPKTNAVVMDHDTWSVKVPDEWVVDVNDDTGFRAHSPKPYGRGPITMVIGLEHLDEVVPPTVYAFTISSNFPDSVSNTDDTILDLDRKPVRYYGTPASFTSIITGSGAVVTLLAVEQTSSNTGFTSLCLADAKFDGNFERCGEVVKSLELKQ